MAMQKRTFRNKRNEHKFIEIKHYDDGHYVWRQQMRFPNGVINDIGTKKGGFRRVRKAWIAEVKEDYEEVR